MLKFQSNKKYIIPTMHIGIKINKILYKTKEIIQDDFSFLNFVNESKLRKKSIYRKMLTTSSDNFDGLRNRELNNIPSSIRAFSNENNLNNNSIGNTKSYGKTNVDSTTNINTRYNTNNNSNKKLKTGNNIQGQRCSLKQAEKMRGTNNSMNPIKTSNNTNLIGMNEISKKKNLPTILTSQGNIHSNSFYQDIPSIKQDFLKFQTFEGGYYDENEIYKVHQRIPDIIRSKIEYFSQNENKNITTDFSKRYHIKDLQFSGGFKSLEIRFVNLSKTYVKDLVFPGPFSLLPIFFYKDIENFQILLSKIITFNSEFDKIEINDTVGSKILSSQLTKNKVSSPAVETGNKKLTNDIKVASSPNHSYNASRRGSCCSINNPISKPVHRASIFKNTGEEEPTVIEENNNKLGKPNYHKHSFIWTTPTYTYRVDISLPELIFHFFENNVTITRFISKNMLFYLYEKNFFNCEFYLINYGFSFKVFRDTLNILFSRNKDPNTRRNIKHITNKIICGNNTILVNSYNHTSTKLLFLNTDSGLVNSGMYIKPPEGKYEISVGNNMTNGNKGNNKYIIKFNFHNMKRIMESVKQFGGKIVKEGLTKFIENKVTVIKPKNDNGTPRENCFESSNNMNNPNNEKEKNKNEIIFNYEFGNSFTEEEWNNICFGIQLYGNSKKTKNIEFSYCGGINKKSSQNLSLFTLLPKVSVFNKSGLSLNEVGNKEVSKQKISSISEFKVVQHNVSDTGDGSEVKTYNLDNIVGDLDYNDLMKWPEHVKQHINGKETKLIIEPTNIPHGQRKSILKSPSRQSNTKFSPRKSGLLFY